ncbi:MAG: hypothetical protein K0S34_2016 [Bacillales bacterium]|jgi:hypothetical protein|nr:hypothetical protein [Bacillales bacterium]
MQLQERLELLEYHLELMLTIINKEKNPFEYYIIKNKLSKNQVDNLLVTCERLDKIMTEQKEEGLMWFESLFQEFKTQLPSSCNIKELINILLISNIHIRLMKEFQKYCR